jgi:hypothetical protein
VTDGINVAQNMDQWWALVSDNETPGSIKLLNICTLAYYDRKKLASKLLSSGILCRVVRNTFFSVTEVSVAFIFSVKVLRWEQ